MNVKEFHIWLEGFLAASPVPDKLDQKRLDLVLAKVTTIKDSKEFGTPLFPDGIPQPDFDITRYTTP